MRRLDTSNLAKETISFYCITRAKNSRFNKTFFDCKYLLHHLHVLHQDLDGREDDGGVGVGQTRRDSFADRLSLALVLRVVVGQRVQNEDLKRQPVLIFLFIIDRTRSLYLFFTETV